MSIVFVNAVKKARAEFIVELLTGKKVPVDANERDRVDHWGRAITGAKDEGGKNG